MLKPNYKPLEITLIKRGKTRQDLREELNISGATLAKISKREYISLKTIAQICEYLKCDITEVVTFKDEI
ncbi:helix-turn-helix domain-containing protein [Metabacillus sediminilitoris]|uniref:Helix-turn-helix transcriptional regulator n=1 Tax=Metabacillus sediminilitoris TaxID=2567941 RepID=A0A4S4BIR3_9BACI|nr:helix-turn-helix transcriptional regulator [Metabacillus sediminilitoris]QGQ46377.1 helix-turn-helix domain-containing protein [Metabacillus sediminilitoris]THF73903.1 helix-turn-helix transcriptional regulator [Metabacillus sediminilitoris]